jgi:hypothetical protein
MFVIVAFVNVAIVVVIESVIAEKSITSIVSFFRVSLTTGMTVLTVVFDGGDESRIVSHVCRARHWTLDE